MLKKSTLLALVLFSSNLSFCATATWIAPVTPENWNTATNWNPATVPTGQDGIANFTSPSPPIPAAPQVNIATANTAIGTINIDSTQNYTFAQSGAGTLQFNVSSGNAAINVTTTLGNGAPTFSVPISLASPLIITQNSTGNMTISGIISGASANSLTKRGTGTLVLSTAINTYSGGTIIDAGKLSINNDNLLGTATAGVVNVTISNGTLEYSASVTTTRLIALTGNASFDVDGAFTGTLSGVVSGAGSLTKADTGTLVLNAANTYSGGTTIGGGTLSISSDGNLGATSGALNISSGTLRLTAALSTARSGTISGTSIISTNATNTYTFSGNFGGSGSLLFTSVGAIAATYNLTGTNSYSGGTIIDTNITVIGTTNSIQGDITFNAGASHLRFDQSFNGTYSGVLNGPLGSSLTKLGSGTVHITGASPAFLGPTTISQGRLNVDGSLANSPLVTVSAGATLGGTGTVGPTTSTGLINPGHAASVGTLHINGVLTMNPGASTSIDIAPITADQIAVNNTATITGPLEVNPTPGFYGFSADYTILTSTGLAGTFAPVTSTNSGFVPTVTYTATNALLHITIAKPFGAFPFSNQNTKAVGDNIDAIFAAGQLSPDLLSVFNTFIGQSVDIINDALDQMHPATYSAFTEMQTEVNGQLISLFHRLPYLPCSCNHPNRCWVEGLGNTLTVKDHGIEVGFQANSGGIAFGYDGQIGNNVVLGIGGAWTNNHLEWKQHRGHGVVNGLYGGIYGDAQFRNFYLGATILAGMDFYKTKRNISFLTTHRQAAADFDAFDLMAQLRTAYLFGAPQAFFYPYLNLDYLYLHTYKFNESGAGGLGLNVFRRTDITLRTEVGLGLQVQDRNYNETICISPRFGIGFVNMTPIERPKLQATFEGASIPFKALGWNKTWNLMNVDFGLSFAYYCFSFMIDYNVEFSPDSHTILMNQHGDIRLDWKW